MYIILIIKTNNILTQSENLPFYHLTHIHIPPYVTIPPQSKNNSPTGPDQPHSHHTHSHITYMRLPPYSWILALKVMDCPSSVVCSQSSTTVVRGQ